MSFLARLSVVVNAFDGLHSRRPFFFLHNSTITTIITSLTYLKPNLSRSLSKGKQLSLDS